MTVSDLHIDDFYRDAGKILAILYGHFPRKMTLFVEDVSGPSTADEFGLHSTRHEACFQAIAWLANSDYLTYEQTIRQEAMDQTVLTHRAFLLLNDKVTHTNDDEQLAPAGDPPLVIHRIRHELKNGSSYSLAETMRDIFMRSRTFGEQLRAGN